MESMYGLMLVKRRSGPSRLYFKGIETLLWLNGAVDLYNSDLLKAWAEDVMKLP